jgi:hypothetical protein
MSPRVQRRALGNSSGRAGRACSPAPHGRRGRRAGQRKSLLPGPASADGAAASEPDWCPRQRPRKELQVPRERKANAVAGPRGRPGLKVKLPLLPLHNSDGVNVNVHDASVRSRVECSQQTHPRLAPRPSLANHCPPVGSGYGLLPPGNRVLPATFGPSAGGRASSRASPEFACVPGS